MTAPDGPAGAEAPLQAHLLSAADSRLRRVVAVVDALPARGDADRLIAPLRPRLARLRPERPITLTRLLFLPVETLIAPTGRWTATSPALPRTVLAVLGNDLRAAAGPAAAALEARFAGRTMADAAAVAACGSELWPQAARLLPTRPPPAGWSAATGLPESAHAAITGPLAALLDEGTALHRLPALGGQAALGEAERLLRRAGAAGTPALAMMLALLLLRLGRAQPLLHLADTIAAAMPETAPPPASERALAFVLGDLREAVAPGSALSHAAEQARRGARMLEALQVAADAAQLSSRLVQVREARRHLAAQCRVRLAAAARHLAAPAQGPAEAADLAALEETARALRRLEAVSRHLGDAEANARALADAAARLAADTLLPPATRLRLAEILLGPDAALALCEAGR